MIKIIHSIWFDRVAIVIIEDEVTHERGAYIGIGKGFEQEGDERQIGELGCKLTLSMVQSIAESLKPRGGAK